jgi:hypothetical protein
MAPAVRSLLPTSAWAWAILAPALAFIATSIDRGYQTDFWHHLARGRAIVDKGDLVNEDLFTYTVLGKEFQDANWLTQVFYYRLYSHGGLALVQFVNSLTLAVVLGVVVALCWRASRSIVLAGAVGAFTFFGLWQVLIIRPQTFSLLLFVLLYGTLTLAERGWRLLLLLLPPVFMGLWANLHGGFPIGLVLIGCFLLAAAWRAWWEQGWGVLRDGYTWALAVCLVASVLATFANPYSWKVYQYVSTTSNVAAARRIDEWVPPGLDLLVSKVWVASVLLLLLLFALPGRRPTVREVILVLCFLPLACGSVRMVAWWLLVSAPISAGLMAANLSRPASAAVPERPTWASGAFFGLIVLAAVLSVPWLESRNPMLWSVRGAGHRTEDDLETVAQRLAERDGTKRIFSRFEWGEYLSWSLSPHYKVFMDARIEIYPDDVWGQYSAITRGRADWHEILDRYQVDCLLLDASYHTELLPQVEKSLAWQRSFQAGDAVLFLRCAEVRAGEVVKR